MGGMENKISRKIRKPLMEKKRRARINQSLDELQQLLAETDLISQGTKLEKADILQMTVQYLKNLRYNINCYESKENFENLIRERYLLEFEKCIEEINYSLKEITKINPFLTDSISSFFKNFLEKIKNEPTANLYTDQQLQQRKGEKKLINFKIKCIGKENCIAEYKKYDKIKIISSKFSEEVSLLLPTKVNKNEKNCSKSSMWRPW